METHLLSGGLQRIRRTNRPAGLLGLLMLSMFLAVRVLGADIAVTEDHADGLYNTGEQVKWTITGVEEGATYSVRASGLKEIANGKLNVSGGQATVSAALDRPGALLLTVKSGGKVGLGGAAVDWQEIKRSAPEPADFDAFWQGKLGELAAVPANPQLEEIASGSPKVQMWKITMNNIRGTHINGYVVRPKGDAPCPGMIMFQAAGLYPLSIRKEQLLYYAGQGWLVLSIIAHDLPVDREKAFYDDLAKGTLKDYQLMGANDREKSYFLRMFLGCYRAVEYLAQRPDRTKDCLVVWGASQGGFQSLAAGGLHPAVTMVNANVPAGCDHTGPLVDRVGGWPGFLRKVEGPEREARLKASPYYDTVNFARRIHCPVLVGVGLVDQVCPPTTVFAMYNELSAPKRIVIMPPVVHTGPYPAYDAMLKVWWEAAAAGKSPPLN